MGQELSNQALRRGWQGMTGRGGSTHTIIGGGRCSLGSDRVGIRVLFVFVGIEDSFRHEATDGGVGTLDALLTGNELNVGFAAAVGTIQQGLSADFTTHQLVLAVAQREQDAHKSRKTTANLFHFKAGVGVTLFVVGTVKELKHREAVLELTVDATGVCFVTLVVLNLCNFYSIVPSGWWGCAERRDVLEGPGGDYERHSISVLVVMVLVVTVSRRGFSLALAVRLGGCPTFCASAWLKM